MDSTIRNRGGFRCDVYQSLTPVLRKTVTKIRRQPHGTPVLRAAMTTSSRSLRATAATVRPSWVMEYL